jgi:hypothetical protein
MQPLLGGSEMRPRLRGNRCSRFATRSQDYFKRRTLADLANLSSKVTISVAPLAKLTRAIR